MFININDISAERILDNNEIVGWRGIQKRYSECLIEAFFRHQETLPPYQRQKYCHIYCPCSRCNPSHL